jgi:toxin-antitoxin system PIN domain toxin
MRHLLDINVLIALMDPDHAFHDRAHAWWGRNGRPWASCPLTENGLVRIMASASYSRSMQFSVREISERLTLFAAGSNHEFRHDSLSLRDATRFDHEKVLSSRNLTAICLLALAAEHGGCLATFDEHIPLNGVKAGKPEHLEVI